MENWRQAIEDEARTWKGTPFHHKGRVKGVGVDCGGYLYCVYAQFFSLPEFPRDYASDWAIHKENEIYLRWIEPFVVETQTPMPGGLALARYGLNFSHAGLTTAKGTIIHAFGRTNNGRVMETKLATFCKGNPMRFFDVGSVQWQC